MIEPIMKKVRGDGIDIQVAIWEGRGKTILCVHGLTANCRSWDLMASSLAPRHRVIAMDLRGRGLSGAPPSGYSLDHHSRDLLALMDNLGLKDTVLMGHSLGAFISLAFAAQYPERVSRLILMDGAGKLNQEQVAKLLDGIKPFVDRLGRVFPTFDSYVSYLKQAPFMQPWNPSIENYFRYEVEQIPGGFRSRLHPDHIAEEIRNFGKIDVSRFYSGVKCRTLILRATEGMLTEDDQVLQREVAERMTREIPNSKCVDLEGTNHYSILFQPSEKRDRILLEFLEE